MIFFKRPHLLRRYSEPKFVRGYSTIPYTDIIFSMDVQTLEDEVITTSDGSKSVQRLKVFCDDIILQRYRSNKTAISSLETYYRRQTG